ncbi:RNA-dependent RNA polymerase 6-like [Chenopodium quinoa]|uniref:RNA-dependent RNA polymerase 6-like n=1 Tax=Chenopodium quinoa TaxID=63459 RepID=UPI000B784B81|nr:RNA-dependent RNA polymerase 6-like [Chenopodium quinoa]
MGSENTEKGSVVTQLSFGGFDNDITAKMFADYIENEMGVQVWRCRLKKSWTPPESYPDFQIQSIEDLVNTDDYEKVEPHAFVHFASPESVRYILDVAGGNGLILYGKVLKVTLGPMNPFRINQMRRTTTPFKLTDVRVDIGTLVSRDEMIVGWKGPSAGVDFLVDPFDATCRLNFTKKTVFAFKDERKNAVINCDFKVEFLAREINEIKRYTDRSGLIIYFQLSSTPLLFYRTADDDIFESVPFSLLDDDDSWIRTTDFTPSGVFGRCNSYRISVPPRNGRKLERAINYLIERRVPVEHPRLPLRVRDEPSFGVQISDPFFCVQHEEGVPFNVTFMLNATVHKGIINQHQLTGKLFDLLRTQSAEVNLAALRHICSYKRPVFDACRRLKLVYDWLLKNPGLLRDSTKLTDIVEVRRLIITPTKAYCLPPDVELSNRVLRHYKDVSDRFLRVTFMDEGMRMLNANVLSYYAPPIVKMITSNTYPQRTSIFKRVNILLKNGFYLCGRMYTFLAFSSNQLRDRSAWFFAEDKRDKRLTVNSIRNWMGKFTNRNVAKCAARMGQCFSSTYATVEISSDQVDSELPDIERNGYVFSDGIGIISPDLAMEVAEKLQLKDNPPCAYQIRFGGCKGVVACWPPKDDKIKIYLRPSMNKFQSRHTVVEVCSWTRFQPGFLNRQIVTLLSALEVPDEVFWRMQETMIAKLNQMLVNTDVAFDVLTASCAEQGNTAAIMLSAGFKPQTEPHLRGMLSCIRAAQLGDLREKARIFVQLGRWLMGCLDEVGVLEQGQCFVQVSNPSLENCFSKHGSRFSEVKRNLQIVKGLVIVAKNPCLHPGDIRILEAVDCPDLHHLFDCLVFPQKGERPHTNEASGSDLDGDLYFVSWDENLIPPSKRSWIPMEYTPAVVRELPRPVNHLDIIEFFTRNMVNENLGTICNAHVVHADLTPYGALDEKCLTLAELAALAVDFPKTGKVVTMPNELKPKMYPDFMGKPETQSYKSDKILGRLYRIILDAYDEDSYLSPELNVSPKDITYDTDLEVPGSDDFTNEAWGLKCSYVGQLCGLLEQYKVSNEEEIVTGHVWSMPRSSSKKQGELKEKLKHAYSCLKREFRQHFDKLGADFEHLDDEEKNSIYEKKASAWYQVTYHSEWVKKSMEVLGPDDEEQVNVILSFAWVPADYLARIKVRNGREKGIMVATEKPINSLANYLAKCMQMS